MRQAVPVGPPVTVGVVTDSTAYLPDGLAERQRIGVVPLHVVLGRRTGVEGREVSPDDVARALRERRLEVHTSRPTPAELVAAYRADGHRQVLSVHLSAALSGTRDSALLAAREVAVEGVEVRVLDTRTIAMGLGFAVLAAAAAAERGASLDEVERAAREAAAATTLLFYVDTLEHLRKGGRIGAARALLGTALAVKPLLHVVDGAVVPLEKVRTSTRALARMVDRAVEAAGGARVDLAVHHLAAPQRAQELADRLRERVGDVGALYVSEVGAVVGAHVGPGLLGVVVYRP